MIIIKKYFVLILGFLFLASNIEAMPRHLGRSKAGLKALLEEQKQKAAQAALLAKHAAQVTAIKGQAKGWKVKAIAAGVAATAATAAAFLARQSLTGLQTRVTQLEDENKKLKEHATKLADEIIELDHEITVLTRELEREERKSRDEKRALLFQLGDTKRQMVAELARDEAQLQVIARNMEECAAVSDRLMRRMDETVKEQIG